MFYQILNENKIMIILGMQLLKTEELVEVDLVTLISLVLFQIYLKIFLEKDLVVAEDVLEDQITEDLT